MTINELIAQIEAEMTTVESRLAVMRGVITTYRTEQETVILPGQTVQPILDAAPIGSRIRFGPGTWNSGFEVNKPLLIDATGAHFIAPNGQSALRVRPRTHNVTITGGMFEGEANDLVLLGSADVAQSSVLDIPTNITLNGPGLRGRMNTKRGIGVHASNWTILNPDILQIGRPNTESQGIATWNSFGPGRVVGGFVEAASINFFVGGSNPSLVGALPTDVTVTGTTFSKIGLPFSGYAVKNLAEVKFGERVFFDGCTFTGAWPDGQDGFAFVVKVSNPSAYVDARTHDVRVRNSVFTEVSAGINIQGHDYNSYCSGQVVGVTVENCYWRIRKATRADRLSRGDFLQCISEPLDVAILNNTIDSDGDTLVRGVRGQKMDINGVRVRAGNVQEFVFQNNAYSPSRYGFFCENEAGDNIPRGGAIDEFFPGALIENNYQGALDGYGTFGVALNGQTTGRQP